MTQATDEGASRGLMCFARADGKLVWTANVKFDGEESTNTQNPYCSSSPATDGEHVVASFGSAGLYGYNFDGVIIRVDDHDELIVVEPSQVPLA